MKIFTSLYNYLCLNKTTIKKIFLFIVIGYLFTDLTFAAETAKGATTSGVDASLSVFNGLLKIFSAILGLLTVAVSLFLDPGWTTGSIIGLDTPLKTLWIFVSNVVYFVFAMLFIWIAFMNIIGKGGEYELKNALPRFIVGVLIVPFSWFIVQFVISVSGVLTVGVLGLPYDTFKDTVYKDLKSKNYTDCDEAGRVISFKSKKEEGDDDTNKNTKTDKTDEADQIVSCKNKTTQVSFDKVLNPSESTNVFGIINIYTYGVMKLDSTGQLFQGDVTQGGTIKTVFDAILKFGFDLIFIVAYCLLLIALTLALFIRGLWLWIFAMFSPILGLLYFLKKGKSGMGKGNVQNLNFDQLIKLALMPVYVAGALSFGLLFIFIAGTGFSADSVENKTDGLTISNSGKTIDYGGTKVTFELNKDSNKSDITGYDGPVGSLLLELFGLAILWGTLIAAMKSSQITDSVVKPFESIGSSVGSLVTNLPSYAPIIPTPSGMMNANGLDSAARTFSGGIQSAGTSKGTNMGNQALAKFGIGDEDYKRLNELATENYNSAEKVTKGLNDLLLNLKADQFNDSTKKGNIISALSKMGLQSEEKTKLENAKDFESFKRVIADNIANGGVGVNGAKGFSEKLQKDGILKSEFGQEKTGTAVLAKMGGGGNVSQVPETSANILGEMSSKTYDNSILVRNGIGNIITDIVGNPSKLNEKIYISDLKTVLKDKLGFNNTDGIKEGIKGKDLHDLLNNMSNWSDGRKPVLSDISQIMDNLKNLK